MPALAEEQTDVTGGCQNMDLPPTASNSANDNVYQIFDPANAASVL